MTKYRSYEKIIDMHQMTINRGGTMETVIDVSLIESICKNYHKRKLKVLRIADVSKSIAKKYAEFCVECDRKGLPLLELDDYIKQY